MKKIILFGISLAAAIIIVGCGTKENGTLTGGNTAGNNGDKNVSDEKHTTSEDKNQNDVNKENTTENNNTPIYTSEDGAPPVDENMKQFYREAEELFYTLKYKKMSVNMDEFVQEDDVLYQLVEDERFKNMDELKTALNKYFTMDFIESEMLEEMWEHPVYKDIDGRLYQMAAQRGGDMSYAGHVFGNVVADENVIQFPVKAYYGNEMPRDVFYTTPANEEMYNVKEFTFEMTKENGEWKFNKFYAMH